MKTELEDAWKLFEQGTDEACDSAALIALRVANDSAEAAEDRAEACFLLGQTARFLQPWRCPDDGVSWFRSALKLWPSHLPSMLALCELAVRTKPMDMSTINKFAPKIEFLRSSMTPGHEKQWADVRQLIGK